MLPDRHTGQNSPLQNAPPMLPQVAIVGRPNVGKSSLLNMLAGKRISIVDPTAGVTRDRITHELDLPPATKSGPPRFCELVDTGGYGVYSGDDKYCVLTDDVETQIRIAVDTADLVLFVIDAIAGVTPLDEQIAQLLRERVGDKTPIVLVANKVDHTNYEAHALESTKLGFGEPVTVSATTKRGKFDLIDAIAEHVGAEKHEVEDIGMKLTIVGKRNAGKSTLTNALAGSERVIVSELPGTTRDSVDVKFQIGKRSFTAIDTAGVRKRKSLEDDIEYYGLHRALRAIRRADVVLFLIDATVPISQVDKKLGKEIVDQYKPCVLVVNKWDLAEDKTTTDKFIDYLTKTLKGLDFAPLVFISAKKNDHVINAVNTACDIYKQAGERITTGQLNAVVKQILEQRGPSSKGGKRAKIYYATMTSVHPPSITLFVNQPKLFDNRYQRYLMNNFRRMLPYEEVPIRLNIRPRRKADADAIPIAEA